MKCWLVVLVLSLVPLTAEVEGSVIAFVGEDWGLGSKGKERKEAAVLAVLSDSHDLESVRGRVRFYLKPDVPRDELEKVGCEITLNERKVENVSEHLIDGSHGPELWFSQIPKMVAGQLAFYGETFPSYLHAVTWQVITDQGQAGNTWTPGHKYGERGLRTFEDYQEVSLTDVCHLDG